MKLGFCCQTKCVIVSFPLKFGRSVKGVAVQFFNLLPCGKGIINLENISIWINCLYFYKRGQTNRPKCLTVSSTQIRPCLNLYIWNDCFWCYALEWSNYQQCNWMQSYRQVKSMYSTASLDPMPCNAMQCNATQCMSMSPIELHIIDSYKASTQFWYEDWRWIV